MEGLRDYNDLIIKKEFGVIRTKKTLYEVLELRKDASSLEISKAYESLSQQLKLKEAILGAEDVQLKQKVLDFAFSTLSVETSRQSYDAKLAAPNQPVISGGPIKLEIAIEENKASPMRRLLSVIAGVMVIWLSMQVIFIFVAYRNNRHLTEDPSTIANQAEEKVRMQAYYQENGVRAGSKIEADLLEVEENRKEALRREAEYAKKEQERKYEAFVRESRQVGDHVSNDLRMAELEAARKKEMEQENIEQEKQREKEAEQRRIEHEKSKWRTGSVNTNYNNYDDN